MLARDAVSRGLDLRIHTPARRIAVEGGKASVVLADDDTIAADAIVLAAGPWTRTLAATAGLDVPIAPRRAQCLATVSIPPSIRRVIAACESRGGVAAGYTQIQQAASGQLLFNTVLSGGLAAEGAQNHVPEVDPAFVRNSIRQLLWLFPSLSGVELLRSWVRYEAVTPDDRFLVGPTPIENLYLAAGDGGGGFARSVAIGRVIADHLDGRPPPFDASAWSPGRFQLTGAA
jgi:sarcosine oxidase subunit beta